MDRWLSRAARVIGAAIGAFVGVVAVQLVRLRRMEFLPADPGFRIDHDVAPAHARAEASPLTVVVLGDSTTAGVGVDRPEASLPHQVARRLADAEGRPVHVIGYGFAGARAAHLVPQQVPQAARTLPTADVVVVVIGANDATHRTRPAAFRAALRETFSAIRAAAPEARIVHAGVPRFRGALRTLEPLMFLTDHYSRLLRPVSREEADAAGVAYADLARDVPPRIRGRTDILAADSFHLSEAGYGAWADVIVDALYADAPHVRSGDVATKVTGEAS
jgi:lysophospholipase L1-like esterase